MVAFIPPKEAGKYKAVASGAITNGAPVIVNSTGTVSEVTKTTSSSSSAAGTPVVFESARADEISIAYDSSNNKAVTAFQDAGNSDHGTAVVLSVDTSLTIGQTYFVQTDGTLSETADDPSVTAGTAVAGSTLIVKG